MVELLGEVPRLLSRFASYASPAVSSGGRLRQTPVQQEEVYDELDEDLEPQHEHHHDGVYKHEPGLDYDMEPEPQTQHQPNELPPTAQERGIPRADIIAVHDRLVKKATGLVELSSTTDNEAYMEASEMVFEAAKDIRGVSQLWRGIRDSD